VSALLAAEELLITRHYGGVSAAVRFDYDFVGPSGPVAEARQRAPTARQELPTHSHRPSEVSVDYDVFEANGTAIVSMKATVRTNGSFSVMMLPNTGPPIGTAIGRAGRWTRFPTVTLWRGLTRTQGGRMAGRGTSFGLYDVEGEHAGAISFAPNSEADLLLQFFGEVPVDLRVLALGGLIGWDRSTPARVG
jgi:hypothetical protein